MEGRGRGKKREDLCVTRWHSKSAAEVYCCARIRPRFFDQTLQELRDNFAEEHASNREEIPNLSPGEEGAEGSDDDGDRNKRGYGH